MVPRVVPDVVTLRDPFLQRAELDGLPNIETGHIQLARQGLNDFAPLGIWQQLEPPFVDQAGVSVRDDPVGTRSIHDLEPVGHLFLDHSRAYEDGSLDSKVLKKISNSETGSKPVVEREPHGMSRKIPRTGKCPHHLIFADRLVGLGHEIDDPSESSPVRHPVKPENLEAPAGQLPSHAADTARTQGADPPRRCRPRSRLGRERHASIMVDRGRGAEAPCTDGRTDRDGRADRPNSHLLEEQWILHRPWVPA